MFSPSFWIRMFEEATRAAFYGATYRYHPRRAPHVELERIDGIRARRIARYCYKRIGILGTV